MYFGKRIDFIIVLIWCRAQWQLANNDLVYFVDGLIWRLTKTALLYYVQLRIYIVPREASI